MGISLKKILRVATYFILITVAAVLAFFLGGRSSLKGYSIVTNPAALVPTAHADAPTLAGSEGGSFGGAGSEGSEGCEGCEGGEGGEGS